MKHLWKFLFAFLLSGPAFPLSGEPLFEGSAPFDIEVTGPLWSLIENKDEREEWPFRLRTGGTEIAMEIKARGNSRLRVCDFPPLRFDFKNAETGGTLFEGQDKLKLVTRCHKGQRSEADVVEEYAAYRIFSILSDISFRVRLVHLDYNDTDGRLKAAFKTSYGFLIEPLDQIVLRTGGSLTGIPAVRLGEIDDKQAALVYVFQYLIGNTDWSFVQADGDESCCHNIELIKIGSKQFPVPFDFDLAGLVNATYARPDASLKITKVRQRLYRGFCTNPDVLREALAAFSSKEDEVLEVIANLPVLAEKEKKKKIEYLQEFFRKADDQAKLINSFEKSCHP